MAPEAEHWLEIFFFFFFLVQLCEHDFYNLDEKKLLLSKLVKQSELGKTKWLKIVRLDILYLPIHIK